VNFFRSLLPLKRYKRKSVEVGTFWKGWVILSANFRQKGSSPTNHCCCQRTRVIALSCRINISAVHCYSAPVLWSTHLSMRLSVCLSASVSLEPLDRSAQNFVCISPVAVARSSSDGFALHYVLPVLWMTLHLAVMGHIALCGRLELLPISYVHDLMSMKHRQTDRQNCDSQDHTSIAAHA